MGNTINRVFWGFIGAFVVIMALVTVYEAVWVLPAKQCLKEHHWWDPERRICATPVDLRMITGRPNRAPAVIGPGAKPTS